MIKNASKPSLLAPFNRPQQLSAGSKSAPPIEIFFLNKTKKQKKLVTLSMFKIRCEFVTPASQFWPAECRNFLTSGVN